MTGFTQTELDDAQAKWNLRFPPDLIALLLERRKVIDFDQKFWIDESDDVIRGMLEWPFEGFWFDVQHGLWWPEWGDKPSQPDEQKDRLRAIFDEAPKLVPVSGHRYIPCEPCEVGNPVFSVYQMDVIIYGANLSDYIQRERRPSRDGSCPQPGRPGVKDIRFWTRSVEFNNERFRKAQSFAFFDKNSTLPES